MEAALPFVDQSFTDQPLIEARLRMTMGWSFWCVGDAEIAAGQFERARTLYTRHQGPDDPDTLRSMNHLANCYGDLGRYAEALQLHEETLGVRKVKLGADHPDTLMSMSNVAFGYDILERSGEALKLGQEALALRKARLGPDHPHTLLSMMGVARSLTLLNRNVEALNLWQETLALQQAKLGPRHPYVFRSMHMLAIVYAKLGRHEDALKLREEVLPLMQAQVGHDNPITLLNMAALAHSYALAGRETEALMLREKMLALARAKLDPDHPDTLMSMADLAVSLMAVNRGGEAVPLIDEYVRRAEGKRLRPGLPPREPQLIELRLRHFEKNQDASGCRATAEMWERLNRTDAGSLYNAACYRAVTAAVVRVDPKPAGTDATRLATEEADRAMAWLRKAVAAGFMNVEHMKQDNDLDALRQREDFKRLLAELPVNEQCRSVSLPNRRILCGGFGAAFSHCFPSSRPLGSVLDPIPTGALPRIRHVHTT
jgi:tetratricopeptide (TPR) repeat protein